MESSQTPTPRQVWRDQESCGRLCVLSGQESGIREKSLFPAREPKVGFCAAVREGADTGRKATDAGLHDLLLTRWEALGF